MPWYRTRLTRFVFVAAAMFGVVAFNPLAPASWHTGPTLRWLHGYVPWWCIWTVTLVYVVLLLWNRLLGVVIAEYAGAAGFAFLLIGWCVTVNESPIVNPFVPAAYLLGCGYHAMAARLAHIQLMLERRECPLFRAASALVRRRG